MLFSLLLPLLPLLFQSCVAQQRKRDDLSQLCWIESEFPTTSGSISVKNSYISPFFLACTWSFVGPVPFVMTVVVTMMRMILMVMMTCV